MEGTEFNEPEFFRAIAESGARALLIGRLALVALGRSVTIAGGQQILFDDLWSRRVSLPLSHGASLVLPSLDDIILTKRLGQRPKDLEDIRLLQALRESGGTS